MLQVKEIKVEMKKHANPVLNQMARLLALKVGKIEKSIKEAKLHMREEANTWFERGLVQACQDPNGTSRAIEYYKKAVQCDVEHYPSIYNLACCYEVQGKLRETKKWLLRLIDVKASFSPAYTALTRVCMDLGEYEEAAKLIQRGIDSLNMSGKLSINCLHPELIVSKNENCGAEKPQTIENSFSER